jgi:predicted HTH transcriptional regulator
MKSFEGLPTDPNQIQQLKKLVAHGEGFQLEFKRKAAFPEKIIQEMIAFANARGGILLVGIGDDKTIPGLKYPEDDSYLIREALKQCKPPLPVTEHAIAVAPNRTVLRYDISESTRKPHYILSADKTKESFVRVDDKCIRASKEVREIARRAIKNKDIRFHYGPHEDLLMKYLDENRSITLKKFMEVSGLKRFIASRKLILLVLADVLRITPHERGDIFSLAFQKD